MLILDEPTAGLDPKQIIETRQLIKALAGDHTIILSTHILPEVSQTCQRVVIINQGHVVAVDTPDNLTAADERIGDDVRAGGRRRRRRCRGADRTWRASRASPSRIAAAASIGYEVDSEKGRDVRRELARAVVEQRVGPARAAADARQPRGSVPLGDHRRRSSARPRPKRAPEVGAVSMTNIIAIAQKELKSYFASPIAYIVIGFWALLYGYFFVAILQFFVRQSMQMNQFGMQGPQAMNVNQQLIRPLLQNVDILRALPDADGDDADLLGGEALGHDRAAAHLAGHRLPDHHGQVPRRDGALLLHARGDADPHRAAVHRTARPEWKPIVTTYIGLLLFGGCFVSVGLFISSLTKNQIVAGMVTFAVFLLLWIITWIGSFSGPTVDKVTQYLSILDHLDDFGKGRPRHDAHHLLPELHHVRAVPHRKVGRQRTVAGLNMTMKRIFDLIGWLGTAIVASRSRWRSVPALNN